ncbi:MAG: family 78 glycoside hydrolase catalytic domain, partial [Clostridia bacterium]|nr:family 78 glycoside hydrolase catalytic domain [Clostridia bacterium]
TALDADGIYGKSNSIGTHYFTAHACNIHAPSFPFGYAEVGFDTTQNHSGYHWHHAISVGTLMEGLHLLPEETEPVRRYPTPLAAVTSLHDGSLLVDLDREIVGGLRLAIDSPRECKITLTYGEQLTDGRVKCPMNTGNRYLETWTLTEGEQTLETLGMMAFRYVQITGLPKEIRLDGIWGLEIRKPFDESASSFISDNTLLNDLHHLVKHTVKVTSQDIYVDSQSRERGAYEGDLLINMLAAYAVEDSFAPARLTVEYLLGHRTWPADYLLMIIFAARADYMATGDDSLLREWYDTLKSNLFTDYLDDTGLIRSPVIGQSTTNAVLVDWPPSERDGYEMEVPYNTVFNALNVRAYADMAMIAAVLGRDTDAIGFSIRADRLRRTMIERLYDPTDGLFMDGLREDGIPSDHAAQHATAFCLSCEVYADSSMADHMAKAIEADQKIRMSVYGAFFLLEGLYRTGHGAIANRLMLDTDASEGARTWAYMMYGLGATVTSEAWNQKNKPNMTLSHPWGAAPAHMIASGILGVTPTSPAYETFDVKVCTDSIGSASGTIPTIRGTIGVSFRNTDEGLDLTVTVPANTTATVYLPDGQVETVGAGIHSFRA